MDKLSAYRVLGLGTESSPEEIKAAYARLSKEFHPEEHPEEFQRIYEAYRTLSRGNRSSHSAYSAFSDEQRVNPQKLHRESYHEDSVSQAENTGSYQFDRAIYRAEQEERRQLYLTISQALNEFKSLLQPKNKEKLKLFQAFFQKEAYQNILKNEEFLNGLAEILTQSKLKKCIYYYIAEFYQFRGTKPDKILPEAQKLYQALNDKCGPLTKKKRDYSWLVVIFWLFCMVSGGMPTDDFMAIFVTVLFVIVLVNLYQRLHRNLPNLFTQMCVTGTILFASLISSSMMEFFATTSMNFEVGRMIAKLLTKASMVWLHLLWVLFLITSIKSIKKSLRSDN